MRRSLPVYTLDSDRTADIDSGPVRANKDFGLLAEAWSSPTAFIDLSEGLADPTGNARHLVGSIVS
jgi:hypothetical protein